MHIFTRVYILRPRRCACYTNDADTTLAIPTDSDVYCHCSLYSIRANHVGIVEQTLLADDVVGCVAAVVMDGMQICSRYSRKTQRMNSKHTTREVHETALIIFALLLLCAQTTDASFCYAAAYHRRHFGAFEIWHSDAMSELPPGLLTQAVHHFLLQTPKNRRERTQSTSVASGSKCGLAEVMSLCTLLSFARCVLLCPPPPPRGPRCPTNIIS